MFDVYRLASLLSKFRIKYSDLIVITDVMKKADEKTKIFFNDLVQEYRKTNDGNNDPGE